jgi:hypothetical protein
VPRPMPAVPRMYLIVVCRPFAAAPFVVRCMYTCGSILEVSRDAAAAGEEQLVSCAGEPSKYCSICTATLGPCGDLPFTSWGRW